MKTVFTNPTFTVILAGAIAFFVLSANSVNAAIFEPGFEVETITGGLTLPTAMAFSLDGRIFLAEKGGIVRVVKDGALLPAPAITLTDINTYGDRGLLGIATDPNFLSNGYLYLSYTYENSPGSNFTGAKTGRIVRVTVVGDTASESSKVILVGTVGGSVTAPSCEDFPITADCIPSDSISHSVGGLRFGPDGKLYATLGEASNFDFADPLSLRAQNFDSFAGKLIRINTDGTAPSDNPFYTGDPNANRSKVYALGLRNAFRLNFNPITGALFLGDVGWSSWEEVNLVTPGANFGWPCWEGNATTTHNCTASSTTTTPTYAYPHDANFAGAVVMGSFPSNGAYPAAYNSSLFFGDYAQNWIKRLVLDASGNVLSVNNFMTADFPYGPPSGPVDISTGPDGNIYYIAIYTGELIRITHTTGNRRPVPVISANPTSGLLPLTVNFSSASSTDPDGNPLSYSWNFGDGATSTVANPAHTYTVAGAYNAVLTLTDDQGSTASKSIMITAGNQAPQASITSPASGSLYVPFEVIQLNGAGTDLEDGTLPASAFNWQIILHHNIHTHPIQGFSSTRNPSFPAPDHSATDVYTEVVLTVTDSTGLTGTQSINLYLNTNQATGNLIQNPSVETESGAVPPRPSGWERGGWGTNNRILSYPVSGFDGAKGLKTEITSYTDGDAKWFFLPVNVTPGASYTYSDYYTATVPSSLSAQFGLSNGTFQYQYLSEVPATGTPTKVQRTILIPAGIQTLSVFHSLSSVGVLTTDNFSLTVQAPATTTPSNLIVNGSFETANGTNPLGWSPVVVPGTTATFGYPTLGMDGGKAVHIEITNIGTDGNARWQFDEIPVTTGTEYTYEEQYKGSTIHDIIGRYTFMDGSEHFFGLKKEIPAATDWTLATGKFVAPENIKSVTLMSLISTNATLDLDQTKMWASGTGTPAELIPPVVAFINPLNGNTVSGIVTLTATATDNVGVAGWFFAADGSPLHIEQSGTPVTFSWNSASVTNGTHTLKITARDAVGNNSREIITVTVDNSTTTPSTNFILNPSLETPGTGGNPDKWSRGGWGTNTRIFTYPVAGTDGASAAKVEITSYTNGDAKWYFEDVSVVAGSTYTVGNAYRSNISSQELIRYTLTGGATQYSFLATLPSTAGVWQNFQQTITIPANVVSMTVFHLIGAAGYLEVDKYSLAAGSAPILDTFSRGMVSYTFDDGWFSHYTQALPILNAASAKGTFYIVSNETINAQTAEQIQNPSLETPGTGGNPDKWSRGGWGTNNRVFTYPVAGTDGASAAKVEITSYTNGDAKWYFEDVAVLPNRQYVISDSYHSTASSQAILRYTLSDTTVQYVSLGVLPSTVGAWQNFQQTITIPANVASVTLFHVLPGTGALTVDNYSLKLVQTFLSVPQMLEIQTAGHEIGAHTRTHPDLTTLTSSEQQDQIAGSRTDLLGVGATPVDTFAYPLGAYNAGIQTITQNAGYTAGRSVGRGFNVKTTDKYALKIQAVMRDTTVAEIQGWVTQTAVDKTWLILMLHQIDNNPLATFGTTPAILQQTVNYIQTANVDVVTVRQGRALMNP